MNLILGRGTWYKKVAQLMGDNWTIKTNHPEYKTVVNWGLTKSRLEQKINDSDLYYPIEHSSHVNFHLINNKYDVCMLMKEHIFVPHTTKNKEELNQNAQYLVKPIYSIGGKNIRLLRPSESLENNRYYQQKIQNRRYELRIHAYSWISPEKWLVYKRTHPEGEAALTWNHKTGGTFSRVDERTGAFSRSLASAKCVLDVLGVQFGAIDFVVSNDDSPLIPWFLEINFSPGMRIPTVRQAYQDAFNQL